MWGSPALPAGHPKRLHFCLFHILGSHVRIYLKYCSQVKMYEVRNPLSSTTGGRVWLLPSGPYNMGFSVSTLFLIHMTKSKVKVAQSCPALCNRMDYYTAHGILQARILEWVPFPFSKGFSQPRDWTQVPALQVDSLPAEPQGNPRILEWVAYPFSSRSSRPRNRTRVSCIAGGFFTNRAKLNQILWRKKVG